MSKSKSVFIPYTDDYKNKCFIVWYMAGRPTRITSIKELLPKDENGRVPTLELIADWRHDMEWDLRADDLDSRAMEKVDNELVRRKAEMLKRQADMGKKMAERGMKSLESRATIKSDMAAIVAVVRGAELERNSLGMSELIEKLAKMSDADIKAEILRLSARAGSEDVIDAEEVEKKDVEIQKDAPTQ